jgi:DNA-binding beta-propeller fold protein YncE
VLRSHSRSRSSCRFALSRCVASAALLAACNKDPVDPVSISRLSANPATLAPGGSTTVEWATQHAVDCAGAGTLPGWAGAKTASGSETFIVGTEGVYEVRLDCRDARNGSASAAVGVTVSAAPPALTIDSFSATPAEIVAGEVTTLKWTTTGAASCAALGTLPGWSGALPVAGRRTLAVAMTGNYDAALSCTDGKGRTVVAQVSVRVLASPLACGGRGAFPTSTVRIANTGRKLAPLGRMTAVGNFPTGGRLSPDGRFYWSVSAGHGRNDVQIVDVATGEVVQVLPLPGAYGEMVFSKDGRHAYVSGEPKGNSIPFGPTKGDDGDVIHVFDVDIASGGAVERDPIPVPATIGGSARINDFPPDLAHVPPVLGTLPSFPVALALSEDDKTLLAVLYNADKVALIDVASGDATMLPVGAYPYGLAIERSGRFAYVSNAYDGTLSKIDLSARSVAGTIWGLGGPKGDRNSQPQRILADPARDRLYVAVTNFDGVAVIDTSIDSVSRFISLKRTEGFGSQPMALAESADGGTLYVADAGENAVVAIALVDRPGSGAKAFEVIGKIPTADYTTDVNVTPDGCTLVWTAGRGSGAGPNPTYGRPLDTPPRVNNDSHGGLYPSYVPDMLVGHVGVLPTPSDSTFAGMTAVVDATVTPENAQSPPADTPVHGAKNPDGTYAPSDKMRYVFYVVRENRTYDQIFGSDPRGDGDPALQVLEDNGVNVPATGPAGPGRGVTPNAHALSRMFVLLDRFFEDSEVSVDGHVITAGAYANNYSVRSMHANYSNRGRPAQDIGVYPISFPPKHFLFDQAVRQNISFRNYGELSGGAAPVASDDGRATYLQVLANSDTAHYPSNLFIGCFPVNNDAPNSPQCAFDAGLGAAPLLAQSRIDAFNATFTVQVASCLPQTIGTPACLVPRFNYLIMPNNHTNGTGAGARDPLAMCADNDLATGQLVDILSHSAIWPQSVIFVVEDDSQDGADHVDAHRAPALVIGPYVKHGGQVIHTRYDQYSAIRTMELILGMRPLSVFDAVATPMYDAFTATPDVTPYTAIMPEQDIKAVNPAGAANAALSAALPYERLDAVPQQLNDRILWQRVHGANAAPPPPGPNASRAEAARAGIAWSLWQSYRDDHEKARTALRAALDYADD